MASGQWAEWEENTYYLCYRPEDMNPFGVSDTSTKALWESMAVSWNLAGLSRYSGLLNFMFWSSVKDQKWEWLICLSSQSDSCFCFPPSQRWIFAYLLVIDYHLWVPTRDPIGLGLQVLQNYRCSWPRYLLEEADMVYDQRIFIDPFKWQIENPA